MLHLKFSIFILSLALCILLDCCSVSAHRRIHKRGASNSENEPEPEEVGHFAIVVLAIKKPNEDTIEDFSNIDPDDIYVVDVKDEMIAKRRKVVEEGMKRIYESDIRDKLNSKLIERKLKELKTPS